MFKDQEFGVVMSSSFVVIINPFNNGHLKCA